MATQRERVIEAARHLPMWVIYGNPSDYPGKMVVRKWVIGEDAKYQPEAEPVIVCETLAETRKVLPAGLVRLPRFEGDDPVIVEVWL